MDSQKLMIPAVVFGICAIAVGYIMYYSKPPHHHVHPLENQCITTFLNTKSVLLGHVNSIYTFLNDFAVRHGTKRSGISGADPMLTQLQVTLSHLKAMRNVKISQIVRLYNQMITDIQKILDIDGHGLSPNANIMFKDYANSFSIYSKYIDYLTPFPDNIPMLITNCRVHT